jgi:hypothetical protein
MRLKHCVIVVQELIYKEGPINIFLVSRITSFLIKKKVIFFVTSLFIFLFNKINHHLPSLSYPKYKFVSIAIFFFLHCLYEKCATD